MTLRVGRFALPPAASVFAVEDTTAQFVWRKLGPATLRVVGDGQTFERDLPAGPGSIIIDDLTPATRYTLTVDSPDLDEPHAETFETLVPPPGREVFRFATMSDLHLSLARFGYLKTMRERPSSATPPSVRCAHAGLEELTAWGAQQLILKGDIVHHGEGHEWDAASALVRASTIPVEVMLGNHETTRKPYSLDPIERWEDEGLKIREPLRFVDAPGIRLIFTDTTHDNHHRGGVEAFADALVEVARDATTPCFIAMHHQIEPYPMPVIYPPGIPNKEATALLRKLERVNPACFFSSGHTHRNRRRDHGPFVTTEVGSSMDYPGVWAGYAVHEGGIRQVVRRVARPDCLAWTEYTRWAVGGVWGVWSPGVLADRSFSHTWP